MAAPRTYWHLEDMQRRPSTYEVATSRLLYLAGPQGFVRDLAVPTPAGQWTEAQRRGSRLQVQSFERFRDPRQTTYTFYMELQRAQELDLERLLDGRAVDYEAGLAPKWIALLERVLTPLCFPLHGLQMLAAYLALTAATGRIAVAALLQCADEIRRIQHLLARVQDIRATHAGFGAQARAYWQDDAHWQPLRALLERLLVTYDWGEVLVAMNLCLKPAFEEVFTVRLATAAELCGDPVLAGWLRSFTADGRWHREWSRALVNVVMEDHPPNVTVVSQWQGKWRPQVNEALSPLTSLIEV